MVIEGGDSTLTGPIPLPNKIPNKQDYKQKGLEVINFKSLWSR